MPFHVGWSGAPAWPLPSEHVVQLYRQEEEIVHSVAERAANALADEQAVLLIATRDHLDPFSRGLESAGVDVEALVASGQLTFVTVEDLMPRFMDGSRIDGEVFKNLVRTLVERSRDQGRFHHVHIFGEIVNVLWRAGDVEGTLRIEQLWHEMRSVLPFTLYCGFEVHELARDALAGPMRDVLLTHDSLIHKGHGSGPRGVIIELADLTREDAAALADQVLPLAPGWAPEDSFTDPAGPSPPQ